MESMDIRLFAANIEHKIEPYVGEYISTLIAITIVAISFASIVSLFLSGCILGFSSIYQNINIPSYPNNIPQQEIKLPPKKDISSTDISSISYYHKFLQYINYRIFRMNIINHQQQTNTDKLILFQLPLSLLTTNINNHNKPIIIRINIPNSCTTVENFQNLIYTKLKDNDLLTDNDKEKPILIKYFSNKSKSKFLVTIDNNTKDNSTTMIPKNELSWIITNDDDIKAIPSGAIIQLLIKEE